MEDQQQQVEQEEVQAEELLQGYTVFPSTFERLMEQGSTGHDALAVYIRLQEIARDQNTSRPWATSAYIRCHDREGARFAELPMGEDRIKAAKALLKKLGLIDYDIIVGKDGRRKTVTIVKALGVLVKKSNRGENAPTSKSNRGENNPGCFGAQVLNPKNEMLYQKEGEPDPENHLGLIDPPRGELAPEVVPPFLPLPEPKKNPEEIPMPGVPSEFASSPSEPASGGPDLSGPSGSSGSPPLGGRDPKFRKAVVNAYHEILGVVPKESAATWDGLWERYREVGRQRFAATLRAYCERRRGPLSFLVADFGTYLPRAKPPKPPEAPLRTCPACKSRIYVTGSLPCPSCGFEATQGADPEKVLRHQVWRAVIGRPVGQDDPESLLAAHPDLTAEIRAEQEEVSRGMRELVSRGFRKPVEATV